MKTSTNFKGTRQALMAVPMALALLAGTTLMTATPAAAQVTTTTTAKKPPTTTATKTSTVEILVSGAVEAEPETVVFEKVRLAISSTLIPADGTNLDRVALDIGFVKAEGYGLESKKKYISSYKEVVQANFAARIELDQIFKFGFAEIKPLAEDLPGLLSLDLDLDSTGAITSAVGSIHTVPVVEPVDPALAQ